MKESPLSTIRTRLAMATLIAFTAVLATPAALAESAGLAQYCGTSSAVDAYGGAGAAVAQTSCQQATSGSGLPFTGLDIGLIVAGGLLLVVVGLLARRFSAQQA